MRASSRTPEVRPEAPVDVGRVLVGRLSRLTGDSTLNESSSLAGAAGGPPGRDGRPERRPALAAAPAPRGFPAGPLVALLVAVGLLAACGRDRPDWRVHALLGGTASHTTVKAPTTVAAYRVSPEMTPPKEGVTHIGAYPATRAAVHVDEATATALARTFLDPATYDWSRVKKMPWTPKIGLRFLRDAERVDLALCLDSDQVLVFHGRTLVHYEDTDAARAELVALAKRLFPDDAYVQELSPEITDE